MIKFKGSVLPKAAAFALPFAIASCVLKELDNRDVIDISGRNFIKSTAAWGFFTATLGFLLVFRTGQCYSRFLACSQSVHTMKAQFSEASSSLFSFCCMSKAPKKDIAVFKDKLIHLFSTIHACALASLTASRENKFVIIDIDHMPTRYIHALQELSAKQRVELSYQWINNLLIREIATGLLNVPPPILSRVFQEMEKAMIEYNQVVQLLEVPFPFPYSQACLFLIFIHVAIMPVVTVTWTGDSVAAFVFTFLVGMCAFALEMTAAQLENPFGDDANDLPCTTIQNDFNSGLQLLLHPSLDDRFVMKKHSTSSIGDQGTWHELEAHNAGDDGDDFAKTITDVEVGELDVPSAGAQAFIDRHKHDSQVKVLEGSPDIAVAPKDNLRTATTSPQSKPPPPKPATAAAAAAAAAGDIDQPHLRTAPPSKQPGATDQFDPKATHRQDNPLMANHVNRERKFEEDILQRLDSIVNALLTPGGDSILNSMLASDRGFGPYLKPKMFTKLPHSGGDDEESKR